MSNNLVIMLNNPGDVVMARQAMEGTDYYLLTDSENCDLFNREDRVLFYPRVEIQKISYNASVDELAKEISSFLEHLKSYNFENVFNLFQGDESAIICSILESNGSEIYGRKFNSYGLFSIDDTFSKYLYTVPFNRDLNALHVVDQYKRILGNTSVAKKVVNRGGHKVVIHISSAWQSKRYSAQKWIEVINLLGKRAIVLTGTKSESDIVDEIIRGISVSVNNMVGETSKKEFADVIKGADILLSADTFAIHLAAQYQVKSIALFGATNPFETSSYVVGSYTIISKDAKSFLGDFDKINNCHVSDIEPELIVTLVDNTIVDFEKYNSIVFESQWINDSLCLVDLNKNNSSYLNFNLNRKILDVITDHHNHKKNDENIFYTKIIDKMISLNKMIIMKLKRAASIANEISRLSKFDEQLEQFPYKYQVFIRLYRIEMNGVSQANYLVFQQRCLKKLLHLISKL